jgi:hypothetical protein
VPRFDFRYTPLIGAASRDFPEVDTELVGRAPVEFNCNRYRRSYSSRTVSGIQFENTFDLEIELKNVILVAFRFFAFLHSQGHLPTLDSA